MTKMLYIVIVVLVTGLYTFVKSHGIMYLKLENFTVNDTTKQILKRVRFSQVLNFRQELQKISLLPPLPTILLEKQLYFNILLT